MRARYRCVTIGDINTASGARIHQNEKGIFIVLLFSSRMIFIYGEVFSLMSEWPRKNQGERKERDRNVIKTLKINSRYTVPRTERRKRIIAESLSLCTCVFFLHAKPVSLYSVAILPFVLILH